MTEVPAKKGVNCVRKAAGCATAAASRASSVDDIHGVHIFCSSFNDGSAQLDMLLAERPQVVNFHLGLPPAEHMQAFKRAGIVLLASATSLAEGLQAQAAGIDRVVAQGYEAGGHRGVFDPLADDQCLGTHDLLNLLATHLLVPAIAAGGLPAAQLVSVLNEEYQASL